MKKQYLIDMLPFADTILSNIKDQIIFDDMQDVQHFLAHYAGYLESYSVYEYADKHFNPNQPLVTNPRR